MVNAQICYGILFEEGFRFPWDNEKYRDGIIDWWKEVNGYKPSPVECWSREGDRLPGITDDQIREYWQHERTWLREHPLPVELVNCCSDGHPIYILAIPESIITANRGIPNNIDAQIFDVEPIPMNGVLAQFCMTYDIEIPDAPRWYLSSYWG
jgi:hypothetical protein